ncbi:MAG: branched-chain amino acid ABC transporter permease [Alphaproteobacteria bacterium]
MTELGLGFFSTLLLGMLANGILAFVVGKILSRFQGDYYAIVSAGLSVIVFSVLLNWKDLTNGPLGIFGIPKPEIGSFRLISNFSYLVLCLAAVALSCGIYVLFDRSSFGRTLKALREDEQLTRLQGYNTKHFKSIVFVVSAMMSGIAGAMFASYISFIDPSTFQLKEGIFFSRLSLSAVCLRPKEALPVR